MLPSTQAVPVSKKALWAGRILSALPALFLLFDGGAKLAQPAPVVEGTVKLGYPPSTALRLSKLLGTSADFWMSLQLRWDLYQASRSEATELKRIKRMKTDHKAVA